MTGCGHCYGRVGLQRRPNRPRRAGDALFRCYSPGGVRAQRALANSHAVQPNVAAATTMTKPVSNERNQSIMTPARGRIDTWHVPRLGKEHGERHRFPYAVLEPRRKLLGKDRHSYARSEHERDAAECANQAGGHTPLTMRRPDE
jgi:hypothetical protein